MKNSKVKYIMILFLTIFLGVGKVKAENLSNISIDFDEGSELENSYLDSYVYITADNFSINEYRLLLTKDNTNILDSIDNPDDAGLIYIFRSDDSNQCYIYGTDYFEYASMYGDVYFTFYEYDGNTFNKASDPVFSERLNYLPLTSRIVMQFYQDKSVGLKINDIFNENSTIKFKIGEITDTNLLKKLDGTNSGAYEELLNYAIGDNSPIQTNQFKINSTDYTSDTLGEYPNLYDVSKIKDGNYYYGYFEIDTENEKYYPLVDVALYKAEEKGHLIHTNFRNSFTPDNSESKEEVNDANTNIEKIENPKTGNIEYIIVLVALVSLGITLYYAIKKYNSVTR